MKKRQISFPNSKQKPKITRSIEIFSLLFPSQAFPAEKASQQKNFTTIQYWGEKEREKQTNTEYIVW